MLRLADAVQRDRKPVWCAACFAAAEWFLNCVVVAAGQAQMVMAINKSVFLCTDQEHLKGERTTKLLSI